MRAFRRPDHDRNPRPVRPDRPRRPPRRGGEARRRRYRRRGLRARHLALRRGPPRQDRGNRPLRGRRLHAPRLRRPAVGQRLRQCRRRPGGTRRAGGGDGPRRAGGSLYRARRCRPAGAELSRPRRARRDHPVGGRDDRDGARGRGRRPRRRGRQQFGRGVGRLVARRPRARHLARLHRLVPHLALQPLRLGDRRHRHRHGARLRVRGEGPPRRSLRPGDASAGRPASAPSAGSTRDAADRPRHRGLRSAGGDRPGRGHRRRGQWRLDRPQDQLHPRQDGRADLRPRHPDHRRSASARAASPRVPSTARASRPRPST